jgi:cytoskeletal protein CcmA (bactofilin family)
VIAQGLKIVGSVTAEGLVEVNGQIDGELYCTSLVVSPSAVITGGIQAGQVVVNGKVEGPIEGDDVVLQSRAHVVGDIQHGSLTIKKGAYFVGRSIHAEQNGHSREPLRIKPRRENVRNGQKTAPVE